MPHPTFKTGADAEEVVFDDVLATRNFVADDLMTGVSVLTGMTTSGAVRTGVVTEVLTGVGIRFDNPVQNGVFWHSMWQHLGDCECPVCCEHLPTVRARMEAVTAAAAEGEAPPPVPIRRTDSGSDYGVLGFPDCEFWERSGYEPLFVATSADYGADGSYLAAAWSRDEAMEAIDSADRDSLTGATLRAWERQREALADAADIYPETADGMEPPSTEWGGVDRPDFLEPATPPRTPRPVICPDAPSRLQERRGAVSPVPFARLEQLDARNVLSVDDVEDIWHASVKVRVPVWHLAVALGAVAVYLFMIVFQLEQCKKCLR